MTEKMIYLAGLNGIRAIAALAVVISHITLSFGEFGLDPYVLGAYDDGNPRTLDLAGYGVSMFFALSGFLITYLLWAEREKQPVQVKRFYMRRILRIWPLYYAYLMLCVIVYVVFDISYDRYSFYYYVFYAANVPFILGRTLPYLSHFWSLGVEEQFYIFWPWINRLQERRIIAFTASLAVVLVATKTYLHLFVPNTLIETAIHVTRFHCMLIGALTAILYRRQHRLFMIMTTHWFAQTVAWGVMLLVATNRFHIASFLDNELITVVTVIIIMGQVTRKSFVSLENPLLDFLGKISYGIYVIHPLVIFFATGILKDITPFAALNYALVYGLVVSTTIVLAHCSYKYFESPFLRLKHDRFSVIHSSGTRNYAEVSRTAPRLGSVDG